MNERTGILLIINGYKIKKKYERLREGSGAGLVLINPEGLEFTYALRLEFQTTNNEAEYEALIAGLKLAKKMVVQKLQVFTDSLLVSNQVNDNYIAKEPNMKKYREKAKEIMNTF